jgi:hypothetical protein
MVVVVSSLSSCQKVQFYLNELSIAFNYREENDSCDAWDFMT